MPRINFSRTERFAQMSKQEQLIAQKRQQIMEKQRTLELAKQIAAEASKDTPSATEVPEAPEASGKVVLPFSNDGSFLERFKQLSEKIVKQTEDQVKLAPTPEPDTAAADVPVTAANPATVPGVSASGSGDHMFKFDVPPPSLIPPLPPPPPPPPPPQLPAMADDVHFEPFYDLPPIIHDHSEQPDGGVVRDGPAVGRDGTSSEVDSNFQVFSEHDKLPTTIEELIQLVADIGDVYEDKLCSRKNDLHPSLWFVFDKHSDAYVSFRRMIQARRLKRSLGSSGAMQIVMADHGNHANDGGGDDDDDDAKYDPADVLDDSIVDEGPETERPAFQHPEQAGRGPAADRVGPGGSDGMFLVSPSAAAPPPPPSAGGEIPIHMMPNFYGDERHFYDDKSTTETDSDTEYVREARERNLKNLKRKTFDAGNRREDGSSTDSDDDYHAMLAGPGDSANESTNEKNGGSSGTTGGSAAGALGSGGFSRLKYRKKYRVGENNEAVGGGAGGTGTGENPDGGGHVPSPWGPPSECRMRDVLQYVYRHYGTVDDLSAECWSKAEQHHRLHLLYDDLVAKVKLHEQFMLSRWDASNGSVDSEQERLLDTTKRESIVAWTTAITSLYERVRPAHLSEFLMRGDYESFVEQFRQMSDRQPNFEDYKEFVLQRAGIRDVVKVETEPQGPQTGGGSRKPEYSSSDSDFASHRDQSTRQQGGSQQPPPPQSAAGGGQSETGGGRDGGSQNVGHSSTATGMKRTFEDSDRQREAAKRRKSRWSEQVVESGGGSGPQPSQAIGLAPYPGASGRAHPPGPPPSLLAGAGTPKLSGVSRTDPALLAYARQNFGSTNLTEEEWTKAEDHYKINLLFQDMLRKRQEIDRLANSGRFKYEYDSDEDTTGGTWEHKLRMQEMEATQKWANELTRQSEGKHHIGDFLPPEELRKFMEKYEAQKTNRQPNLSDYKDYKLREDNVGFQMLQKLGWKQGQGLGADGSGIVDPINKASQRDNNQGLGIIAPDNPEVNDNEYDAYRKRMMLAYRFRPNPLNNPRRAYY
ncbi:uncharacterized protein LOC128275128 [Anopheles cruzii]|uniref:uncharacterized protein LOC128275128 n=1 Tax=Anopheles cruzii TaxID=68878 RepID=UPI0022EC289A|nr:uncharacterized protein LOC128275128 [Anopheles cruzii]